MRLHVAVVPRQGQCTLRVAEGITGVGDRSQARKSEVIAVGMTCPSVQAGVKTTGFKRGSSECEMFEMSSES